MARSITGMVCLWALFWASASFATQENPGVALFAEQRPFEMVITADFRQLLRRSGWSEGDWYDAIIEVAANGGERRRLKARMSVRTGFRTRNDNCSFPQFFVDFSETDTTGTVFEGQKILPMTSHCRASARYSRYVHREMIAYRIYNLLSPKSLQVRTANVTYKRSDKASVLTTRQAFFVEHFDDLAARLEATRVNPELFHPLAGEPFEMGVLELFQFMIGNTDFSTAFQHNVLLIQQPGESITAVPFDFDFSGLVNANYAKPASQFKTRSVRTRIYRGWCRSEADLQRVIDHFQAKKPEIFALLDGVDWIDAAVRADMRRYLESFYSVIDSPKELDQQIRSKCGRGTPVKPEE